MRRRGWIVIVLALAIVAAVTLFPLRLVLGSSGIVADDVSGSVWRGRIANARWHGIDLGDLDTRARLWPPAMDFAGPVLRGRLTPTGVADLSGTIEDIEGLPLAQIAVDNVTVLLDRAGCTSARGEVAVYAQPLPQLGAFSGPLRCETGVLRAALTPEQGDAHLDLSLTADRRYRAVLTVDSLPAMARMLLIAAGFEATSTGVALSREGQI
ncbi:type II secretion system protein N [Polymorphobacter fuscus]|uniref:General secretion pathway protein N n=1 Tax=Sandarakinorhabdus fusca TaxID=1439888 RepID=A0A7C9GWY2_9SPHN|nr:type II secretion system protein N [Polymorphobacter fuscus]KAB7644391.1 type II secretion system protein N [Polymorphobacter fuscus]MQT18309.1 hypothetical protein [Polymorphobacter fuscus]NJC08205.1 hypothetical protein [Polymorphobacter fuscus]